MPDVDAVVVPVGGAGLIAGVACAVKTLKPDCKVSYCQEENIDIYQSVSSKPLQTFVR